MTGTAPEGSLVPLSETDRTVADVDADVRDYDVVASDGEKVGTVDDLIVDGDEVKVRFLRVASGGFLGIGTEHFLVPVDVITSTADDRVRIDRDRARLADVPAYDPALTREPNYYEDLYGWWGAAPYWGAGYVYPPIFWGP